MPAAPKVSEQDKGAYRLQPGLESSLGGVHLPLRKLPLGKTWTPTGFSGPTILVCSKFCLVPWNSRYVEFHKLIKGTSFLRLFLIFLCSVFKRPTYLTFTNVYFRCVFSKFWGLLRHFLRFFSFHQSTWAVYLRLNLLLPLPVQAHSHRTICYLKSRYKSGDI